MGLWDVGKGSGKYSTSAVKESTIVSSIVKYINIKYPKAWVWKVHGGCYQRSGVPDIHITYRGHSIWIEVKKPGGDTTALQKHTLETLRDVGAFVGTVTSVEEALTMMGDIDKVLDKQ